MLLSSDESYCVLCGLKEEEFTMQHERYIYPTMNFNAAISRYDIVYNSPLITFRSTLNHVLLGLA